MKIGEFELNRCYFEDCVAAMKRIPSRSFDICIADPPWKTSIESGWHSKKGRKIITRDIDYQNYDVEWHVKWINEARRIAKIVIFCVPTKDMNQWMKLLDPDCIFIVYFKNGMRPSKISHINCYSPYFTFIGEQPRRKPLYNVIEMYLESGFLNMNKFVHPSAKTSGLFKRFIEGYDAKSVIDPFLGSGCTAEDAEEIGIPWLGFEIEKKYNSDIEKRIGLGKEKREKSNRRTIF